MILLFARDPAGANVILPVYRRLRKKYYVMLLAKDYAWKRLSREPECEVLDISLECKNGTYEEIVQLLQEKDVSIVVTATSLDDYTERYIWKAAEMLHIKSFAILDQWMNLGIRFSQYNYKQMEQYEKEHRHLFLPYRILAMDKLAKKQLIKDGVPQERIVITGQPHFDTIHSNYRKAQKAYDNDCYIIVFASEPILEDYDSGNSQDLYWGYNEISIFEAIYRQVIKIVPNVEKKICLIIRPHPREEAGKWNTYVEEYSNDQIIVMCDKDSDNFSVLKSADLVCGMSSMFLLEAMICQKRVLSVEIGLRRENPFVLDKIGLSKSILTEDALYENLKAAMIFSERNEGRENNFHYISNAIDRIVTLIEEEIQHE